MHSTIYCVLYKHRLFAFMAFRSLSTNSVIHWTLTLDSTTKTGQTAAVKIDTANTGVTSMRQKGGNSCCFGDIEMNDSFREYTRKLLSAKAFFSRKCSKCHSAAGFRPDPLGQLPPDSLAGLRGPTSRGGEGKKRKGWENLPHFNFPSGYATVCD